MTDLALSSAVSSLMLLQKQMSVTSSNISNANTAGYTAETVQVGDVVVNGMGGGVQDLGITNNVDKFLQAQVINANSQSTQSSTYSSYYQNLQQIMGQISQSATGGNDISSQLATLQGDLSTLAATPQNSSLTNGVISAMDSLTSNMRASSQQIQSLRGQADQQISDTVDEVNGQLDQINSLNTQIASAQATGGSTVALEDQRNTALQTLSADIGVQYYTNDQGQMQVFTNAGQALIIGNVVNHLSHTSVSISGNVTYPSGGINGIMVGSNDITSTITTGKIASLIQQRDTELPDAQNSLNYLAQQLSSGLNAVSNLGSANPPPSTLTSATPADYLDGTQSDGTTPVLTTSSANSGQQDFVVRVALVDSSGQAQAYQDVDLSGLTSVGQITSAINSQFSATDKNGNAVSLADASGGPLTMGLPTDSSVYPITITTGSGSTAQQVTLTAPIGIAVSTLSGGMVNDNNTAYGITPGSATQQPSYTDFSSFFHLNDVISGGGAAATIAVNPAMLKNSSLMPVGKLNSTQPAPSTIPFAGVGAGDGTTAQAMSTAMLTNQTFTTGTATGTTLFDSPATGLTTSVQGAFTINGGGGALVSVNIPVNAGDTVTPAYIAQAINTAAAAAGSSVSATLTGNGVYQLQITGGGSSLSFSNVTGNVLSTLGLSSAPVGHLGAATTTYGGFASNLISDIAGRASDAQTDSTAKSTSLTALKTTFSNQSGVNVDQQTANLTQLQNLYAASARVITTVNAMFSSLIQAVGA